MTKEKQIEEMAMIMCEHNCEECRRESIEFYGNSYDEDTQCVFNAGAEALYIAGYRKIQEGSVVVSKNEYEELNITGKYFNDALKQARKETVKEILFKVESAFAYFDNEDMFSKKAILRRVKEATNQYAVEV